ncbi:MAG: lysozyme [Chitinophagaceae bacterium]|nr:lysozyme [Chitinophagaceae bacterium]
MAKAKRQIKRSNSKRSLSGSLAKSVIRTLPSLTEVQHLSKTGLAFIGKEEGCILKPYLDSVGVPTIGFGNTYYENGVRVKLSDPPISKDRALSLFLNILSLYEKTVWSNTRDDINQNQFDALVSLTYNIGVNAFKKSTVLKLVNKNPADIKITDAFKMWKNAGGKPILLNRRIREAKLYFS